MTKKHADVLHSWAVKEVQFQAADATITRLLEERISLENVIVSQAKERYLKVGV